MNSARNLRNRAWLVDRLRGEIVGPDPPDASRASVLAYAERLGFSSWSEFRRPKVQPNGDEVLWQDPPVKRYGAGVLFPAGTTEATDLASEAKSGDALGEEVEPLPDADTPEADSDGPTPVRAAPAADDGGDFDVSLANAYRPSALGISILLDVDRAPEGLEVEVSAALYRKAKADIRPVSGPGCVERDLWFRAPLLDPSTSTQPVVRLRTDDLSPTRAARSYGIPGSEGAPLQLLVVSRPDPSGTASGRLLTVCLVNRARRDAGSLNECCYFQCGIAIRANSRMGAIRPYPTTQLRSQEPADEEAILRLLYRDRPTFAVGHGCAAGWSRPAPDSSAGWDRCDGVWTDTAPVCETPSTDADLLDRSGQPIRVSMRRLAGLDASENGMGEIEALLGEYSRWIAELRDLDSPRSVQLGVPRPAIPEELRPTARVLLHRCEECLSRMEEGLAFLRADTSLSRTAREAFALANEAMLVAQLRASRTIRIPHWDAEAGRIVFDVPIAPSNPAEAHPLLGYWRAFQIGFLLTALRGACDPDHPDRLRVDLIWFPTGGGKTEAYLGLSAFVLFFNRLSGRKPAGVDVLMRYTLRLLTAQQFQRGALLFCAIEHVRRRHRAQLGDEEFRLGMWVGGNTTPNDRRTAVRQLRELQKSPQTSDNPFVLLKCPWCNARFGPAAGDSTQPWRRTGGRAGRVESPITVFGYQHRRNAAGQETVVFQCPDPQCEYGSRPLPVLVIDEDIYDAPPSLLVATVDKFAMLAWKPQVRSIFGIDPGGRRVGTPPSLVIQDELHLISGPLGSTVGAYETLIEELCSDAQQGGSMLRPKIVASTATISRADEQIGALYARRSVSLFPPSGLEAGDSFFARESAPGTAGAAGGRLYVGVMAPAHGSQQTTLARVSAALLQYPAMMPVDDEQSERDPWWTLVCFFNSLRELGGAATLLVADTRDYLRVVLDRHGFGYDAIRQLLNWIELTSRVPSDQIPLAIQKLEGPFRRGSDGRVRDVVDACLASNIIEVGVDIDRLGLMLVAGQPKTTAQYIQVTSRVGRRRDTPGLVVTVYSQSKPRDRSHYERFRSYHARLYAQVEPTSVTPFSAPAVDRTLHGLLVGLARQTTSLASDSPRPFPLPVGSALRQRAERMVGERVERVDRDEAPLVRRRLIQRLAEWEAWNPESYGGFGPPAENPPLIHAAGSAPLPSWNGHSWPTLTSMRDVDATCEADVTSHYNEVESGEDEA